MWCVARFSISNYLAFAWSFEHIQMHAHAFFYLPVVSIRLYELACRSNGPIKSQRLECQSNGLGVYTRSHLTTFECCFLVSKYHENCNGMSSFTVIYHVPLCHENFHFHWSSMFLSGRCVFYLLFTIFLKRHWNIHVFIWVVKMGLTALGVLLTHT